MLRRLGEGLLLAGMLVPRVACGEPGSTRSATIEADGYTGWIEGRHNGGVLLGATGRFRFSGLTGGVSVQGATILLSSVASLSGVGGVSLGSDTARLSVLAELGVNAYTRVGSNFMSGDPGAEAALPFVGGRPSLLFRALRAGPRDTEIWLGPALQYADDLGRQQRTYSYQAREDGWISGNDTERNVTRTVSVGQRRLGALLVISLSVPL
jgi:hypothetical protein